MTILENIIKELSHKKNEAYDNGHVVSAKTYKEAIKIVRKYKKYEKRDN